MKRKVTFRRFALPWSGEENERGEFIDSFNEEIEGKDPTEISEHADERAKQLSAEWKEDVQVFEIPVFW